MSQRLKLKDRVSVTRTTSNPKDKKTKSTLQGVVAYVGPVKFAEGDNWVGIRLIGNSVGQGRNDGSVDGVLYFEERCSPRDGIFVRQDAVTQTIGSRRSSFGRGSTLVALQLQVEEEDARDEKEEDSRLEDSERDGIVVGQSNTERMALPIRKTVSLERLLGSRIEVLEKKVESLKSDRVNLESMLEEMTLDNHRMKEQLEIVILDNENLRKQLHALIPKETNETTEVEETIMKFSSSGCMYNTGRVHVIRAQRQIEASSHINTQEEIESYRPDAVQLGKIDEMYGEDKRVHGYFSIPVQNRGTTICQLHAIHANLERRCEIEGWTNCDGKQITAKDVCLSDVNKYVIKPFTEFSRKSLIDGATLWIREIIFRQSLTLDPTALVMRKYEVTCVGDERVLQREYQVVAMDLEIIKTPNVCPAVPIEKKYRDEQ